MWRHGGWVARRELDPARAVDARAELDPGSKGFVEPDRAAWAAGIDQAQVRKLSGA